MPRLINAWRAHGTRAATAFAAVVALTLGVLAALHEGVETTDVELHEGSVWLSNGSLLMAGHLNHESKVLDGSVRPASADFEVLQQASAMLVHDRSGNTLSPVDPASMAFLSTIKLPRGAVVALGGPTVAIVEPATGNVWVLPLDSVAGVEVATMPPAATIGAGAAVAVSGRGTVVAVSAETGVAARIAVSEYGITTEVEESQWLDEPAGALQLSMVGERAVALDADAGLVYLPGGGQASVPDNGTAVLQQSSAARDSVAIASATQLIDQPLAGGDATVAQLDGRGVPAAPVYLNGCVYAAWAETGEYRRDCIGDQFDVAVDIDGALPGGRYVFRVNRDIVVLNDYINGTGWAATEGMERVDDWEALLPPPAEDLPEIEPSPEVEPNELLDRSAENIPPVAADDVFGARAGNTTILPVLDNDYDLDGDVLTASLVDVSGVAGNVQVIRGGAALQVVLAETAAGDQTFVYRTGDGRGGFDDATVTVSVMGEDTNTAPESTRASRLTLEAGASASYNVVPDFRDPEGDVLFLRSVGTNADDIVEFTPDGTITVTAHPERAGFREIPFVVSDGQADMPGSLLVTVANPETQQPLANPDHVVTTAGRPVTYNPILNDVSRSGLPLRLATVTEVAGATRVPDYANDTFTFTSDSVGTYYLQYLVTDNLKQSANVIRVDVLPETETVAPPVAVADVALVPPGQDVLVDVLANDSDPAGGVLVVPSVSVPDNSGIAVTILEHRLLRITNVSGLEEPVTVEYAVSNGDFTTISEVTVLEVEAARQTLPPEAVDDEVVVRVGDIATVDLLDNDSHPNGIDFSVDGLIEPLVDPEYADVFLSESSLRVRAGTEPGVATATYAIVDRYGQKDVATVKIRVLAETDDNAAPRPDDVVARVLAGQTVRIPVPLDGIDPDGDSVRLVGLAGAPAKGRIVHVGQDWLLFEAFGEARGADTFEYLVRDRLGAEARGTIVVGVAPAELTNNVPTALNDDVTIAVGRALSYPVMQNDSDPDADVIGLDAEYLVVDDGMTAEVRGDRIYVVSDQVGQYSVQYRIVDSYGATALGVLQVTVAEEAPLLPPIARDDRVTLDEVAGEETVDVVVLENDEDPDGVVGELEVDVDELVATVNADRSIAVPVLDTGQIIRYTVTDRDGQSASAFILVPGVGDLGPSLVSTAPIEVVSGETITIDLGAHVETATGNPALITRVDAVSAAHGNGDDLVVDGYTLEYTSQEGYWGKDGITFEATDGLSVDDPEGTLATLTLPITVIPAVNVAPGFRNSVLQVAPGEEAQSIDLQLLASDPNPDDEESLTFDIAADAPVGLDISLDGSTLVAQASPEVPRGTDVAVSVTVSDGDLRFSDGIVVVEVVASTRVLPQAVDDFVDDGRPGVAVTVDVLANDLNPFEADGLPLELESVEVEAGEGSANVVDGQVVLTPAAGFYGSLVARYEISDATGDQDRRVEGRVELAVVKAPDAPGKPELVSVEDGLVVLEWQSPPANGAPIEYYTVRSDQGSSHQCAVSICTIDGLTNDTTYRFTVTATNRAGESAPSPASDAARPDIRPDQPAPPVLTFGDTYLDVEWVTPDTAGSAVTSFTLEITPPPVTGSTQRTVTAVPGAVQSLRWDGLANGTAYQVRVQAHNDAPSPSAWSEFSATEVPAGPPAAPAKPTTSLLDSVGNNAQMNVSWTAPYSNGDAISGYRIEVLRGGAVVNTLTVGAGVTSQAIDVTTSSESYTFRVAARNKAGYGDASPTSDPRRAVAEPGAPQSITVSTPRADGTIDVSFTPGPLYGVKASEANYQYRLSGQSTWRSLPASNTISSGISINSVYTVDLRVVSDPIDGVTYTGTVGTSSNSAEPYGPPLAGTVSATELDSGARFSWSTPSRNGRDIVLIEYRIDGGAWTDTGTTVGGTHTEGIAQGESATFQLRVTDSAGQTSTSNTVTGKRTPATAVLRKGDQFHCSRHIPGSSDPTCWYFEVVTSNFKAGTRTYECELRGGNFGGGTRQVRFPKNGSVQLSCFSGHENLGQQYRVRIHNVPGGAQGDGNDVVTPWKSW